MTGCSKKVVKAGIEAIGRYLINNSEKIAGDFDGMTDFNLTVSFRTNDDEGVYGPKVQFSNEHYIPLPWTAELERAIYEEECL